MLTLKVLGSGSSGNCYLLEDEEQCLVLDAGIKFCDVKKALDFNISKIVGLCVTHAHGDHNKYSSDFAKCGIPIFEPYTGGKQKSHMGNFEIQAFDVPHDGTECRGFIVTYKGEYRILYITDYEYCPYTFKSQNLNAMIVEMNYAEEFVGDAVNRGHVFKGHAEMRTALDFIRVNNSDALENVILAHLSTANSDKAYFINETSKVVSCPIYVAERGISIKLKEG